MNYKKKDFVMRKQDSVFVKKIAHMIKRDFYSFKPGPTPTSLINVRMPMKQNHDIIRAQHHNKLHLLPEECQISKFKPKKIDPETNMPDPNEPEVPNS